MNKIAVLFLMLVCFTHSAFPQEAQFSQFDRFPVFLNPASTGMVLHHRTSLIYRIQWIGIPGAFSTYGFSYDKKWGKMKSGLGLVMVQDKTSNGGFSTLTVGGLYAYHLQISKKKFISSGVRVSYFQQNLDPEKLTFTDQLIRNDGNTLPLTYEIFENQKHAFGDISWGLLFSSIDALLKHKYWFGFALDHLNTPLIAFLDSKGILSPKYSIHGGGKYPLIKDTKGDPTSEITFTFLYKAQQKWDQGEVGVLYEFRGIGAGLSYRGIPFFKRYKMGYANHDAMIVLLGYSNDNIQIGYSFDFTISKLGVVNTKGSHEVSLINKFNIKQSKKGKSKKKSLF